MPGFGLILLLVPTSPGEADLQAEAEAAFRAGAERRKDAALARPHFQRAVALLEDLQARGAHNPAIFLQLGNARLLADDLPGAILAYHQGLSLAPNDRALTSALEQARSRVAYPAGGFARPATDELPPWLPRPGPGTLLLGTLGCFTFACVALTRARMLACRRRLVLGLCGLGLTGMGVALLVVTERARAVDGPLVVIAADDVLLRRGNGLAYPPRYPMPLPRGAEARLRRERGDWLQIQLAGGEIGWVPRELTRGG